MPTRPDTLQGSLPLLVLTILARRGPLHGYAITTHIQRLSEANGGGRLDKSTPDYDRT
jgi:DNA-binding PadR family transcriptional regulator